MNKSRRREVSATSLDGPYLACSATTPSSAYAGDTVGYGREASRRVAVVARRDGESLALSKMTTHDVVHRRIFLRQWRFSDGWFNSAYHPPSQLAPMSSYCPSALQCWLWSPFGDLAATTRATSCGGCPLRWSSRLVWE